jgi:hypothetical protein
MSVEDEIELVPNTYSIASLLLQHKEAVLELQSLAPPPTTPDPYCKYDDLFYLRYILSFGNAKKSKEAVEWAFNFRSDSKFQRIAEICTGADSEAKILDMSVVKESKKWQVADKLENVFTVETGGGVAVLIRAGMCDSSTMFDRVTQADMWDMNLLQREASFQECDQLTRESGMLCKNTMFLDMADAKLSSMMDSRQSKSHSEMSAIASKVYPQLMDKFCILNAPSWMGWLMALFSKFASKRSMEKVELFTSNDALWSSEWAKKRLVRKNFPHFLGGEIPPEKISDSLTGKLLQKSPIPEVTISARSKEMIDIVIPVKGKWTVDYIVAVLARGIEFSARFLPDNSSDSDSSRVAAGVVMLRESGKVKAEEGPAKGTWTIDAQGSGVVRVEFDNGYSMLRSKTVKYSFDLNTLDRIAADVVAGVADVNVSV